ncbi:MAG: hypothetical protein ACR2IB_08620, partial [Pyrinomonadaceae bacterium]
RRRESICSDDYPTSARLRAIPVPWLLECVGVVNSYAIQQFTTGEDHVPQDTVFATGFGVQNTAALVTNPSG